MSPYPSHKTSKTPLAQNYNWVSNDFIFVQCSNVNKQISLRLLDLSYSLLFVVLIQYADRLPFWFLVDFLNESYLGLGLQKIYGCWPLIWCILALSSSAKTVHTAIDNFNTYLTRVCKVGRCCLATCKKRHVINYSWSQHLKCHNLCYIANLLLNFLQYFIHV